MADLIATPADDQPLHKAARRYRWFVQAFDYQREATAKETGNTYEVDNERLTEVFADWLSAFEAQKPEDGKDNLAYVGFAAGLMLRSLIRHKPVRCTAKPEDAAADNPAWFWPEGYLYVAFCLNVRGLVLQSDFHGEQRPSDLLGEMRTWWSFKENVSEDPSQAIAFLDLFAGDEPQWQMPQVFHARPGNALENAHHPQLES